MAFQKGDAVQVVKRGLWSTGHTGVVDMVKHDSVSVIMDFNNNTLTFNPSSLKVVTPTVSNNNAHKNNNKGDHIMLMGNYNVARVRFVEGTNTAKSYYYALYDNEILVGDYVVIKSANHGMGIAKVHEIYCDDYITQEMRNSCNAGREIIAKFDMSAYETRKNNREQAKKLKVEMEKKIQEVQELALFELMAEKSPELKEMLTKYKELMK